MIRKLRDISGLCAVWDTYSSRIDRVSEDGIKPGLRWTLAGKVLVCSGVNILLVVLVAVLCSWLALTQGSLQTWQWWLAILSAFVFSALLWMRFVQHLNRRIRELMRATQTIAEGKFDVRLKTAGSDELAVLAGEVNRMAERLDGFVKGQKRFMGDVAHELCSPIARLQMAVGILEQQGAPVDRLREEVEEISSLVNELLSFSKASLRKRDLPLEAVPLRELVEAVVRKEAAGVQGITIEITDSITILADGALLQRALANVVRNAVRYAAWAGPIKIFTRASAEPDSMELVVRDRGPGVPATALPKLFDPFYRVDASRTRATGGTGLGLAIVKASVESFGAKVTCSNGDPSGLEVVITLRQV